MWYRVATHFCYCHLINCKHHDDPKERHTRAHKSVIASGTPECSKLPLQAEFHTNIKYYSPAPELAQVHLDSGVKNINRILRLKCDYHIFKNESIEYFMFDLQREAHVSTKSNKTIII